MANWQAVRGPDEWISRIQRDSTVRSQMQTIATVNGLDIEVATRIFVLYLYPDMFNFSIALTRASVTPLHPSWVDFRDSFLAGNDRINPITWMQ